MNWYMQALKRWNDFNGRSRRKEYWFFLLFNVIAAAVLSIIDMFTGTYNATTGIGLLSGIYALVMLVPGIAVTIRRLHDTGRSGWWLLLMLVPLIGPLVLLYWYVQPSQEGASQFG